MKCHSHPDSDATGICSTCNKGVCPDCMVEVNERSTCGSEACVQALEHTMFIIGRNYKAVSGWKSDIKFGPTAYIFLGILLIGLSLKNGYLWEFRFPYPLFAVTGAFFLVAGVRNYVRWSKVVKDD